MGGSLLLKIIEVIVLLGIIAAFILPVFFSSEK
jgi:type II secretory pathway pseudopilin PulG